jgi:hypothetical protein
MVPIPFGRKLSAKQPAPLQRFQRLLERASLAASACFSCSARTIIRRGLPWRHVTSSRYVRFRHQRFYHADRERASLPCTKVPRVPGRDEPQAIGPRKAKGAVSAIPPSMIDGYAVNACRKALVPIPATAACWLQGSIRSSGSGGSGMARAARRSQTKLIHCQKASDQRSRPAPS